MEVLHERIANVKRGSRAYCISHVYINGVYSHDAIEDYDRGLDESMTEAQIAKTKVYKKTAIPTGTYRIKMNVVSGTFSKKPYYRDLCVWTRNDGKKLYGCVPRMDPVKGFVGILQHRGEDENSSAGCVIVGKNTIVGKVTDSKAVFEMLYAKYIQAALNGEDIVYKVTRKYKV